MLIYRKLRVMFVYVVIQLREPNLLDLSSNLKRIYDR